MHPGPPLLCDTQPTHNIHGIAVFSISLLTSSLRHYITLCISLFATSIHFCSLSLMSSPVLYIQSTTILMSVATPCAWLAAFSTELSAGSILHRTAAAMMLAVHAVSSHSSSVATALMPLGRMLGGTVCN